MANTRFAPSPTGYLHIGGLRTALYNYLWAKKTGGKFRLRIEDTDMQRNSEEAMIAIIEAFRWTGLNFNDEVEYQSKRLDIYQKYINKLLEEGKAYFCYLPKEELDLLREEQKARGETPRYDCRYRDFRGTPPSGIDPVVRIKSPQEGNIEFEDGIKGSMSFSALEVDDFVIARGNKIPTYNFVVAIDDALMGITEILRGDDHLSNTPKQIIIYNALDFNIPKFYHIPMINNHEGKKLSKRDGAMDVMEYKKLGYLPEAILNFLVRLGWSYGDQEIFSKEEMLNLFDPTNINKSSSSYNEDKLNWLNAHYIKNTPNSKLAHLIEELGCKVKGHDRVEMILDLTKERASTLVEMKESISKILSNTVIYEHSGVNKFINDSAIQNLNNYLNYLENCNNSNKLHLACDYEAVTKPFLEENKIKMPQLFQPIRLALTGSTQAPSVYDIMAILGLDEVKRRISKAIKLNFCRV